MAEWDIKDKSFLITGGASGMGARYAEVFLKEEAKSVAILDVAEEVGKDITERFNKTYGGKVVFIKCDVGNEEDITRAFDAVLAQFKQIDVIVNNAGLMVDAPHMWRTACDVNWQGLVSFTLKGIKHMRKDEGGAGGTIVNIASTAALWKSPTLPIYYGSKAAVLQFSQCLSMDPFYQLTGIRILTLCLGSTDTPLHHNLEVRSYDKTFGQFLVESVRVNQIVFQKQESGAAAMVHMFKNGAPGSAWLSLKNKPAKDITPILDENYKKLEDVMNE